MSRAAACIAAVAFMVGCDADVNSAAPVPQVERQSDSSGYACRPARALPSAEVWPIPSDAEKTASGVFTKRIKEGAGRTPEVGTGQVLVLCITYYDKAGSVVDHESSVVHDIDLPPAEWREVLTRMKEREIRRLWIPKRAHLKDDVIADFELEPFPLPDNESKRRPPSTK